MHPRDKNGQKLSVCSSSTGCMGLCKEHEKSDLNVIGLGMTNYLKILKTLSITFFIIILMNIVLYVTFTGSNPRKVRDYNDALFRTTIGNIGSGNIIYIKINIYFFIKNRRFLLPKI